ncbi:MAG: Gfo/Idh/MocA family oxidoreductase [Candidatus Omnitrophica bacterium]|nr:Gfo/Idh/MocA family oxidoreductase [Candidatus Omnitrophota bacterium]
MREYKIGFIGYKGQAGRLIKIFENIKRCKISCFYHPEKHIDVKQIAVCNHPDLFATRKLSDLYSCAGIVICAPNYMHFSYLKELIKDYRGYIFCEKPPVSNFRELASLRKFSTADKKRVYFNFNQRFGFLAELLKVFPKRYNLGEPIRAAIVSGHGLGFQESYKSSWRAKKELHEGGVLETLGIHFIDLLSFTFGASKNIFCFAENLSPYGDAIDTCHFSCIFGSKLYFNLTCSYCMPFTHSIKIDYTNGSIDIDDKEIKVFTPREVFDKNGRFVRPPLRYRKLIDYNKLYSESLEVSCQYFMDCLCKRREINLEYFKQSILSNEIYLKALENV